MINSLCYSLKIYELCKQCEDLIMNRIYLKKKKKKKKPQEVFILGKDSSSLSFSVLDDKKTNTGIRFYFIFKRLDKLFISSVVILHFWSWRRTVVGFNDFKIMCFDNGRQKLLKAVKLVVYIINNRILH